MSFKILTAKDIQQVLSMQDAINIMKEAFTQLALGQVNMPLRTSIPITKHQAVTLCMPAYLAAPEQLIELGMIINGSTHGRTTSDQITLFKSVGLAIQDISTAYYAAKAAEKLNQGMIIKWN